MKTLLIFVFAAMLLATIGCGNKEDSAEKSAEQSQSVSKTTMDLHTAVVLNRLAIVRGVVSIDSVKICKPDFGRVFFQVTGNPVNDGFHSRHSLRATESSESGIGRVVGFPGTGQNPYVGNEIGIVGMKHSPLQDGVRKVIGCASIAV